MAKAGQRRGEAANSGHLKHCPREGARGSLSAHAMRDLGVRLCEIESESALAVQCVSARNEQHILKVLLVNL